MTGPSRLTIAVAAACSLAVDVAGVVGVLTVALVVAWPVFCILSHGGGR